MFFTSSATVRGRGSASSRAIEWSPHPSPLPGVPLSTPPVLVDEALCGAFGQIRGRNLIDAVPCICIVEQPFEIQLPIGIALFG